MANACWKIQKKQRPILFLNNAFAYSAKKYPFNLNKDLYGIFRPYQSRS